MNLENLIKLQSKLDEHIKLRKGLEGKYLLQDKVLALYSELGELLNEWRGFKFWSDGQEPRTCKVKICNICGGSGVPHGIPCESGVDCWQCNGTGEIRTNPLLMEYVDGLHFVLSIGLDIGINLENKKVGVFYSSGKWGGSIKTQIFSLMDTITNFAKHHTPVNRGHDTRKIYILILEEYIGLGKLLGFTEKQIEDAYLEKNKINHERQESGY